MVDTGLVTPEGWTENDGALERTFELPSFVEALAFVNRVGELAEALEQRADAVEFHRRARRHQSNTFRLLNGPGGKSSGKLYSPPAAETRNPGHHKSYSNCTRARRRAISPVTQP